MTKQEILDEFDDIDFVYNNSSKHETLSHMLDELLEEQEAVAPFYEEGEDFLNYFMKHTMGRCGHCKAPLPALDGMRSKFCWMCGRQVKWNDR